MTIASALAVYFVIWWTVLFAILPWGVRSLHEEGGGQPGSDPGAPSQPRLVQKALWTTAVTCVLFAAFYAYVEYL